MRGIVHTQVCGMAVLCTHKSLRCEHLLEGETNGRSPGASASRELSINRVKQARTTLHTKKRQTHILLHASQRLWENAVTSMKHEGRHERN